MTDDRSTPLSSRAGVDAPPAVFSGNERLHQNERTASRTIDGQAVVITIDQNELHVFNAVGSRVWELADGRALSQVVDDIVSEFEVERPQAVSDVYQFVGELVRVGAAHIEAPQP
jgi:hypothetical protein